MRIADDDTWSDIFSRVLVERIEPQLGLGAATLLCEYPLPEAALARPAADPNVAVALWMLLWPSELKECPPNTNAIREARS